VRFFIDAQLPRILVERLIELGHDAVHVTELPKAGDTPTGRSRSTPTSAALSW